MIMASASKGSPMSRKTNRDADKGASDKLDEPPKQSGKAETAASA